MSPEKQRISIAEACGWSRSKDGDWIDHNDRTCVYALDEDLPDYLNDLNAMQSAVLSQGEVFIGRFSDMLTDVSKSLGKRIAEMSAKEWAAIFLKLKSHENSDG